MATPIGNLGDITLRGLEVLRSVPLLAAEDTRLTRRLLDRYEIAVAMTSFHARSGPSRLTALLEHLRGGADLAVVTDAGTPGVSDPGAELVAAWAAEGGRVVAIPGASAVLAAVVSAGVVGPRWAFEGFLPRSGRERRDRLARIAADERATVLFEAPGRVAATLADLAEACQAERPAAVCRELTKVHETIERGTLGELAVSAREGAIPTRGEFVLVVGQGAARQAGAPEDALGAARAEVERLVAEGTARGEAARRVAIATGVPRRRLYGQR
ncbi:MAG TPA: 16S rRNA (cytidine(1402)-2'-O)-methyltransferase [Clostridia bacterium]|nr:16S rRNA (cytidine(1402)-2'-O)-methyltransferase [Clostridia bacterium]